MPTDHRAKLATIKRFDQLIAYLRDEMGWPIGRDSFEEVDDLFYDFTADELGIDPKTAAKIQEIKRLRPLSPKQPWGIFFVKFEPKKLPVVALRRILSQVAFKKRASANSAERAAWAADDLLFVSNYGEGEERQISFAHFSRAQDGHDLPTLKVLGWDDRDTALHLDAVAKQLSENLAWPGADDPDEWRKQWSRAFTLRHREVVTTSKELSIRLAELARRIRDRIRTALAIETEKGSLTKLMKAFQTALVHDLDADGFADMYAQTIAYGLLSARIADPLKKTADDFAAHMRTNPFLRELMETFLKVGGRRGKAGGPGIDFDELGVSEVVELLDGANMEAVVRDFGDRNPQEDPVIHFYELFLKEYDAKKRMQRGVFYTPRPVVSYIVRSVDELLRTEFGLADGLADTTTWGEIAKHHKDLKIPDGVSPDQDFVQILDPATGTGTFLVEVLDLIYKTLVAKWKAQGHGEKKINALWNEYVPKHLLTRLHGYELLMAPYAIAHLKIGLKLYETGYRFNSDERARVYLTNALEPAQDLSGRFEFAIPALAHEAQAVNQVKRSQRFTVVIGNPPYSIISANTGPWIVDLCEAYKTTVRHRERQIQALSDDYVKFLRLAQWQLENSATGILAMITNNGYLDGHLFVDLRASLLITCPLTHVLNLHGNLRTGERTPEGKPDENVFDIQTGVAIILASKPQWLASGCVRYADLWGGRGEKYATLSEGDRGRTAWQVLESSSSSAPWIPIAIEAGSEWSDMKSLLEVFGTGDPKRDAQNRYAAGFVSQQDDFAIAFTKEEISARVETLLSPRTTEAALRQQFRLCTTAQWSFLRAREELAGEDIGSLLTPCSYRPFDRRYTVFHRGVVSILRKELMRHLVRRDNIALLATRGISRQRYAHAFAVTGPVDRHALDNASESMFVFPLFLYPDSVFGLGGGALFQQEKRDINLAPRFRGALARAVASESQIDPEDIFDYVYAVLYSPAYRDRYAGFLQRDFPRLPIPGGPDVFWSLARLGRELIALHILQSPALEHGTATYDGPKAPRVERVAWLSETVWLDAPATRKGEMMRAGTIGFRGVPEDVWSFHIGGYQVCEKWLKDRKGRTLSKDDIAHYQKIVVALAETLRLMKEIDKVIEQHGGWPGAFQTGDIKAATDKVLPFRPCTVEPKPKEHYVACVPLVPLKAAAGAFGDPQHIEDDGFEWVAVSARHRLRPGMFVAQVVGKSMEPAVPDGSWCLFRSPVEGTRHGKTVLVQLRDATDPETGQRYTVKRYESEKASKGDSWRHERITLKPLNPDFEPIVLTGRVEGELQVIAELVEVLGSEA